MDQDLINAAVKRNVEEALAEDIHTGDITAALIPADKTLHASVITREDTTLCGQPWVNEVFAQLDTAFGTETRIKWAANDGDAVSEGDVLFNIRGNARTLLTGERTALNFLQTLCATAHLSQRYKRAANGHAITLLDTRKTLPGLRIAQKYAVKVGGCSNHRLGLWDAFLIKENHIAACGGIAKAVESARALKPETPVQVEVETHSELEEALLAKAEIIMLDNFTKEETLRILATPAPNSVFEVSGNIDLDNFEPLPSCQPYRVSSGALTKHVQAVDLSFRVIE